MQKFDFWLPSRKSLQSRFRRIDSQRGGMGVMGGGWRAMMARRFVGPVRVEAVAVEATSASEASVKLEAVQWQMRVRQRCE